MGRVLHCLPFRYEIADLRASLEVLQQLVHLQLGLLLQQRPDTDNDPQRDALLVGIQESTTQHPFGQSAKIELSRALIRAEIEPLLDGLGGQFDDLLGGNGVVTGLLSLPQASLLGDERQHPVGRHHHVGSDLVLLPHHYAHNPAVFHDHVVSAVLGQDKSPCLSNLVTEPSVKSSPQKGVAMVWLVPEPPAVQRDGRGGVLGHHGQSLPGNVPFKGSVIPEARQVVTQGSHVDPASRDVLGSGVIPTLHDHGVHARLRQHIGCRQSCETRSYNDNFYFPFVRLSHPLLPLSSPLDSDEPGPRRRACSYPTTLSIPS